MARLYDVSTHNLVTAADLGINAGQYTELVAQSLRTRGSGAIEAAGRWVFAS